MGSRDWSAFRRKNSQRLLARCRFLPVEPVSCPTPAIIPVSKGGGRSVAQMTIRRAQPSESREVSAWILFVSHAPYSLQFWMGAPHRKWQFSLKRAKCPGISHSRVHRSSPHALPRRFAFLLARIAANDWSRRRPRFRARRGSRCSLPPAHGAPAFRLSGLIDSVAAAVYRRYMDDNSTEPEAA